MKRKRKPNNSPNAIPLIPTLGRLAFFILLAIIPAFAQPSQYPNGFELLCPAGSIPANDPVATSFNFLTAKWRANICVSADNQNLITFNATASGAWPFNVTSGSSTIGGNASLSFFNNGQNIGSQLWIQNSFYQPLTNTTGAPGSGVSGLPIAASFLGYQVWTTASGNTTAGPILAGATCAAGGNCSVTINHPASAPAGITNWSVYGCATTGGGICASGLPTLQAQCTNLSITSNCVITTISTGGSGQPLINTAWIQPPNVQNTECPTSVIPYVFTQDNSGNYHTYAGMDTYTNNGNTGVYTICGKTFFTDFAGSPTNNLADPVSYNNGFMAINHYFGNSNVNTVGQDRALSIAALQPLNDSATRHGLEGLQLELDVNCNGCTINGSPDGEVSGLSVQVQDSSTTNYSSSFGTNILRGTFSKQSTGVSSVYNIINGDFGWFNTTFSTFVGATGLNWVVSPPSSVTNGNLLTAAVRCNFETLAQLTAGQNCIYALGGVPLGNTNFIIRNDNHSIPSLMNGTLYNDGLVNDSISTYSVNASMNVTGSVATVQTSGLSSQIGTCSGGTTAYFYAIVGIDANGGQNPTTPITTAATCTNPLTSGNPVTLPPPPGTTIANTNYLGSFVRIDIYRTGGPMATGKIGSYTCTSINANGGMGCTSFVDTGLAASGTLPAANSTGSLQTAYGVKNTNTCTSSASPAVCGNATAGFVNVPAGSTTVTVNTTAMAANSIILTQPDQSLGTALGVTCNTTLNNIDISARVAGTSFTVVTNTPVTNPECFSFLIINPN